MQNDPAPDFELDEDDRPVGQVLSRRRALRLFGLAVPVLGVGALAQRGSPGGTSAGTSSVTSLPGCVVRPALTEGPYFVPDLLSRRDIRADSRTKAVRPGVPLELTFVVSRVGNLRCEPRKDVKIEVWHCDALGAYSGVNDPVAGASARAQDFLRGNQLTDASGRATFRTIYPGWYPGRAVHIHFKLEVLTAGRVTGEFTSQLFFDEAVSDRVFTAPPYNTKTGRRTLNANDGIYRNGGSQLLLNVSGNNAGGYKGTFDVGLNI